MNLERKQKVVAQFKGVVEESQAMIFLACEGLGVSDSTKLRRELDKEGASLRVIKNTLMARAIEGSPVEFLADILKGQIAVAFTDKDPVSLAKALAAFMKTNKKLEVIGGSLGESPLVPEQVKALAALPTLEVVKSMLLGTLVGVPQQFLGVLQAPARDFLYLLKAREEDLGN